MKMFDIINRIGFFRSKKNLSARELSLRIGKHEGYINKLESKDFNLPTKALLEILEALDLSCEEFFSKNYRTYQIDFELKTIIESLSQEKKILLLNFLK